MLSILGKGSRRFQSKNS